MFAIGALAVVATTGAGTQPSGTTALYTSQVPVQHNVIVVGKWTTDPPAACTGKYAAVIYGTMGDDVLRGGNKSQVIMGLGGNDTIYAGNSGDCLVGGDGNDQLVGGNGKDILLGGPGDDYLDGRNATDALQGGTGVDECIGGNGTDTIVSCENAPAPATAASLAVPELEPTP